MRLFVSLVLGLLTAAASAQSVPLDPTRDLGPDKAKPPAQAKTLKKPAQWIWLGEPRDNQTVYLRGRFELAAVPKSATLYITCDNLFTAWVNGHRVAETVARPGGFEWREIQVVDVSKWLRAGRNVIAARGWNESGAAGLLALLKWDDRRFISDGSWRGSESLISDWEQPDPDVSGWEKVRVLGAAGSPPWVNLINYPDPLSEIIPEHLKSLPVAPMAVLNATSGRGNIVNADRLLEVDGKAATVSVPVEVSKLVEPPAPSDEKDAKAREETMRKAEAELWDRVRTMTPGMLIDFGREVHGNFRVHSMADHPVTVMVSLGESAGEALNGPYYPRTRLTVPPHGMAHTSRTAFRYAQLNILDTGGEEAKLAGVDVEFIYYPVRYAGSFRCSDPLLNRIWEVGAYTVHLCMQEDIWDAPKRDRWRWIGDLHVESATIHSAFPDTFLLRGTIDRLRTDAQSANEVVPHDHVNGIPGYSCAWIVCLADEYRYSGDLKYVRLHRDHLVSLLDYLRGDLDERGMFANKHGKWPFVDWSPALGDNDPKGSTPDQNAATHMFLYAALQEGAWLLRQLGDSEADRFQTCAEEARRVANKFLWNAQTGTFGPRHQINAMAVCSGLATSEQMKTIADLLLSPYVNDDRATPYYNFYVCEALARAGRWPETLKFIRAYWGEMIHRGATTWWETFDPRDGANPDIPGVGPDWHGRMGYGTSLSHGWSSAPTSWLTRYVLGVSFDKPGGTHVIVDPHLCDLKWAEGDVPTPHGVIHVRHEWKGDALRTRIVLPKGVTARLGNVDLTPGSHEVVKGRERSD